MICVDSVIDLTHFPPRELFSITVHVCHTKLILGGPFLEGRTAWSFSRLALDNRHADN